MVPLVRKAKQLSDTNRNKLSRRDVKGSPSDKFPEIVLDKGSLWGIQTQRSLLNFDIGTQQFEPVFIDALINIKRACAQTNHAEGLLTTDHYEAIVFACDELLQGNYRDQFPLRVWQTGSGTHTNMNVNEVICSLANSYIANHKKDKQRKKKQINRVTIHPNDHVNMSQSSNDVFPSAMHIAVAQQTHEKLFKTLDLLDGQLSQKQTEFDSIYTVGRTHLMDALPLTTGAILSGYRSQLTEATKAIQESLYGVYQLAIGGTAVGTGCNAPREFGQKVSGLLAKKYKLPFKPHENLIAAVSGADALLRYSGALKQLASGLFKIANDFRLLGSGPRCGFNEWRLPANEPGSSIMPGKVNPTQSEALSMVCLQVFGNDLTVSLAASHGRLQLNTYRPVIILNIMESIVLLSDAMESFAEHCISGLALNTIQIEANMASNLSAITVLVPELGYDAAARIVTEAYNNNITLAEASKSLGLYNRVEFEALLHEQLREISAGSTGC